jgi:hypothetical protein
VDTAVVVVVATAVVEEDTVVEEVVTEEVVVVDTEVVVVDLVVSTLIPISLSLLVPMLQVLVDTVVRADTVVEDSEACSDDNLIVAS